MWGEKERLAHTQTRKEKKKKRSLLATTPARRRGRRRVPVSDQPISLRQNDVPCPRGGGGREQGVGDEERSLPLLLPVI